MTYLEELKRDREFWKGFFIFAAVLVALVIGYAAFAPVEWFQIHSCCCQ